MIFYRPTDYKSNRFARSMSTQKYLEEPLGEKDLEFTRGILSSDLLHTERDRKIEQPPLKPYQVLKRLKEPLPQPPPRYLGDRMKNEDIDGTTSRRLYRGVPKDIFKVEEIEGARPHKARRSPRSYAFDDYKDVTTARKYRKPYENQLGSPFSNYYNSTPKLESQQKRYSKDQYNLMSYYDLPRIDSHNPELKIPQASINKAAANPYLSRAIISRKNNRTQNNAAYNTFDRAHTLKNNELTMSPDFKKEMSIFYGEDNQDTLDQEMLRSKIAEESRLKFLQAQENRIKGNSTQFR